MQKLKHFKFPKKAINFPNNNFSQLIKPIRIEK